MGKRAQYKNPDIINGKHWETADHNKILKAKAVQGTTNQLFRKSRLENYEIEKYYAKKNKKIEKQTIQLSRDGFEPDFCGLESGRVLEIRTAGRIGPVHL